MKSLNFGLITCLMLCGLQTQTRANFDETAKKHSLTDFKASPNSLHLRQIYIEYCSHCHGLAGRPTSLVEKVMPEMPDFSRLDWSDYKQSDVVVSIADGIGQMPGFKRILTKLEMESVAFMITKFPSGKPSSLIQKRFRFLEADLRLLEKIALLNEELQSLRDEAKSEK